MNNSKVLVNHGLFQAIQTVKVWRQKRRNVSIPIFVSMYENPSFILKLEISWLILSAMSSIIKGLL